MMRRVQCSFNTEAPRSRRRSNCAGPAQEKLRVVLVSVVHYCLAPWSQGLSNGQKISEKREMTTWSP